MLLGERANDYDIATNATPETIAKLFRRTLTIGAKFGVVMVLIGNRKIEVATFRSDSEYHDGRRPKDVVFTDARHDAERRDFTINGMFLEPISGELIDYVGGQKDVKNRTIRAIGNPDKRFAEDHLRMLRAIRFASRLDFKIEAATWNAVCKYAHKIKNISAERIATELEQILTDPNRTVGIKLAADSGLLGIIFETIAPDDLNTGMRVLAELPKRSSFAMALAGLLVQTDGRTAGRICRRLGSSNELRKNVQWLVEKRAELLDAIPLSKGHLKKWLAEPLFEPLTRLCKCYLRASGQSQGVSRTLNRQIRSLGDEPIAPKRLLDGHELIGLGARPGPAVGHLAEELYLAQLENKVHTKAQARKWAADWLERHTE